MDAKVKQIICTLSIYPENKCSINIPVFVEINKVVENTKQLFLMNIQRVAIMESFIGHSLLRIKN